MTYAGRLNRTVIHTTYGPDEVGANALEFRAFLGRHSRTVDGLDINRTNGPEERRTLGRRKRNNPPKVKRT